MIEKGTGRLYVRDERDDEYMLRRLLRSVQRAGLPSYRRWNTGPVLDQGLLPQCVGYALIGWLMAAPTMTATGPQPHEVYYDAQKVDEWEGEDYAGTSVRAGAKVLQARGHIESYFWGRTASEVRDFILAKGPVVVGTNWYPEMDYPNKQQFLELPSTTRWPDSGHAYLLTAFSGARNAFRMQNSWGRAWGQNGRVWIRYDDLHRLLREDGEAFVGLEQRVRPAA